VNPEIKDKVNHAKFDPVNVIDTFKNELILESANSITTASFHPLYVGPTKDSIYLNYNMRELSYRDYNWIEYSYPKSSDLLIFIDTTQYIGSINILNRFLSKSIHKNKSIKSYPIFLQNISKDTLNFGFGNYIPLILQAKDSSGDWKPIQKEFRYSCGTGLSYFYLPPDELLISSCKIFNGNYKTQLRLVYGYDETAFSNEFTGHINYSQFDKSVVNR